MSTNKSTYEIVTDLAYFLSQHSGNSLIEYTAPARAMPITQVDTRAGQLPYIESVLHSMVSIYAGYYLQAWQLSLNVGNVDVIRTLDKLNPNRDPLSGVKGGRLGGFTLQHDMSALPFGVESVYPPKADNYTQKNQSLAATLGEAGAQEPQSAQIDRDFLKQHNENANLSVGKILSLTVESENGAKAAIPVLVQLQVSNVQPALMVHTLTLSYKEDKTLTSRFREWRAGMISGINDLLFCDDLILEYRKNLHADKDGHFRQRQRASSKNTAAAILSGTPSVGTASSIYVMVQQTASELELKLKGRLSDFRTREKLFDETKGMLLVVIDDEWQRVTVYHRSIERPTEVSVKEIQRKNKQNGPDILEVLNQYNQRQSPVI